MSFALLFRRAALGALLLAGPVATYAQPGAAFRLPPGATAADYRPGVLIFRVADRYRAACAATRVEVPALQRALATLGAGTPERVFPHSPAPTAAQREREPRSVDLTLVYRVRYAAGMDIERAVSLLRATGAVRYAEPDYVARTRFAPSDPEAVNQYHLPQIHALEAWDTQKGDTTVLIGIVDTGVQLDHPDLASQIQRNFADPVNGVDDDGDGYVDNYRGWDFAGDHLNNPTQDNYAGGGNGTYHGTHVAGLAAAATDNGVGVAGVGFRCRLLPVKCGPDDNGGFIINGYPGLVYAADHGCDIINCSWGAAGYPDLGQDAINYATFNRGALVVTAAGNSGWADPFSPAGFENVLTVGAVDRNDVKTGFSNYGVNTEVFAPGLAVLSTVYFSGYNPNSGTSMASPVTAGAAGLVKAQFPAYSGEQVGQQVRMTCDNIDALNPATAGLMGRGRINVLRAITENPSAVRFLRKQYLDGGGLPTSLYAGATVLLRGEFKSILKPTTGLTATLSCNSADVTIQQGSVTLGNLATGQTVALTAANAFRLVVSATAPADRVVRFKITYADQAGHQDEDQFEAFLNPSWRDVTVNLVQTSMTSKGRVGFNDNKWAQGLGMVYRNHDNLTAEIGLLVGTDTAHVSNAVTRLGTYPPVIDEHFQPLGGPVRPLTAPRSDQDLAGQMTDAGAGGRALPVQVRYRSYAWRAAPHDKYVLLTYTLVNPGPQPLQNVYAGLFGDWDIGNSLANHADWDATRNLGYAYSNEVDSAYAGLRYLGAVSQATFRAIDFDASLTGNPWGLSDGFTRAEKWEALSQGVSRTQAGLGGGSDVCTVSGAGPFTILPGDSVRVAFALVAGDNLANLQAVSDDAAFQYQTILAAPADAALARLLPPYPNPARAGRLTLPATGRAGLVEVFDARGARLLRQRVTAHTATALDLSARAAGLYVVRFTDEAGRARSWRVVVEM